MACRRSRKKLRSKTTAGLSGRRWTIAREPRINRSCDAAVQTNNAVVAFLIAVLIYLGFDPHEQFARKCARRRTGNCRQRPCAWLLAALAEHRGSAANAYGRPWIYLPLRPLMTCHSISVDRKRKRGNLIRWVAVPLLLIRVPTIKFFVWPHSLVPVKTTVAQM